MTEIQLQQGSSQWLQWRLGGVGGSDVSILMGSCPYENCSRELLFLEKTGQHKKESNFEMRRGSRLEPIARRQVERVLKQTFLPVCYQHAEYAWMRASLDGYCTNLETVLEIKAPNYLTHDSVLLGLVPPHIMHQVQWQLAICSQARNALVCTYNDGQRFTHDKHLAIVEVRHDPVMQAELFAVARKFWDEVLEYRERKAS